MNDRLREYLSSNGLNPSIQPLTPDASTRDYFRLSENGSTSIACVYPSAFPSGEVHPYVDVTSLFESGGIRVPSVLDVNNRLGIILVEDVGDTILRDVLLTSSAENRKHLLHRAISLIADIQSTTESAVATNSIASRLSFDFEKLNWELEFFREHYFSSYRKSDVGLSVAATEELGRAAHQLAARAVTVAHRDFHAANLMLDLHGELIVIDHQDARLGSIAYDLVSLLLDRIDTVPCSDEIEESIDTFLAARSSRNLSDVSKEDFVYEFRLQSIQRCLKAVGTFSYQTAVRGKSGYTAYIEPMLKVVIESAERLGDYPNLARELKLEIEPQTR